MKFLGKINRQYFWTLVIVLLLISLSGYILLQLIVKHEIKEDIFEKEEAIIKEIKTGHNLINIYPFIETKQIHDNEIEPKVFRKIYLSDEAGGEESEPFLEYSNSIRIDDNYYLIRIRHSYLDTDDLVIAIAIPLLLLLVLTFAFSFFITKKFNRTIWTDFEQNLKQIEKFSFKSTNKLCLKSTNIYEFDRLNETVLRMTGNLGNDYFSLKEFTENASHEMQTPISIVLLNLEELLQDKLDEKAFARVVSAINSTKRLSGLNQSLILLTKIENSQFNSERKLGVQSFVKQKLQDFEPLFKTKKLKIKLKLNDDLFIKINDKLMDVLINNLLSNAVKHNQQDGTIMISISDKEFSICNTGKANSLTDKTIFNRFAKENSDSYGLGLAIVKKICDKHQLEIHYAKTDLHCFEINKKA